MGLGMARVLVGAGHEVFGQDISAERLDAFLASGGKAVPDNRADAAPDVIVCVVLNAQQTEEVLFDPESGWAGHMAPGSVIVSCATVPPGFACEMEDRATRAGLLYLDAPISGGAAKAAKGALSVMASGSEAAFAKAAGVLDAVAETVHNLGPKAGMGSAMKSVNQLLAGVHIAAMGEALALAVSQNLDLRQVVEVVSASAGTSWMFENRAPHVLDGDYTPRSSVSIWPKDLGIVSDIAGGAGLPVPMARAALEQFKAAAMAGDAQADDAAVTRVYARAAGLSLPGEG